MASTSIGQTAELPVKPVQSVRNASPWIWIRLLTALKKSIAILTLLAVWEIVPQTGLVDSTFLPPLHIVLQGWWELLISGQLTQHIRASLTRSFAGFFIAIAYAIPLGLLIGWYKTFGQFINPLIELFRNTAALALLPVFILILGIGETSKIAIIVYACSWPILLNTISGVRNVDPLLIRSARSMGLSSFKLFQKVILPAAVPFIFIGIRLSGAVSILVLIAAEMIGAKAGLGYLITYSQYNFQISYMYAGILTISTIGLIVNQSLVLLERKFSSWQAPHGE